MKITDLHCDTISLLYECPQVVRLYKNDFSIDIKKLQKGDYLLQCFAIFLKSKEESRPYQKTLKMIELFKDEMDKNTSFIRQVYDYDDILLNMQNEKISALLTIEDSALTGYDDNNIKTLYDLGVRMITLTWNYDNKVGSPNNVSENILNDKDGLTEFGIKFIHKLNDMGIIIDVSHLSDKGFYDVLKYSKKPFIASHSNARRICNSVRNLTDDMIIKLDKIGGVMGINYYEKFLSTNKEDDYIDCIIKHIKHIKEIASINVIALGSDFDGISPNHSLKDASFIQVLVQRLLENNFTMEEVEKICYKNSLRVFKTILK